ncbi:MAG TPA: potassium-transporting ATPase subunit KdpA [Gemmatimonadaceae bacterium]|nr:potassium-transporting ATPase subunit KdpA [Gemmatimonadaceae bacterium]HPV77081.1 potassium-transporting ATPase subunit KdpA [Gemmatimonadaceae bacterium]
MTTNGWLQIAFFSACVMLVAKPLGIYLVRVYDGSLRWLAPVERAIYRIAGIDPNEDQHWTRYAAGVLLFSAASMLLTYIALRLQALLPLNPQGMAALPPRQAFETAASFTTNTNWQSYSGESTMSYLSQMMQLAFHNFVSSAVGMGVAVALVRGISRRSAGKLGNFWVDTVRGTLYVLLPFSLVFALLLVQQGAIQNFRPYVELTTLEGATQVLAMGPVASQEAIKQIGTNGGGFFNANSAHPFENPTPWTNFWQMLTIFLIPSAMTYMLGRMVKNQRHGWAVWSAMFVLFFGGVTTAYWAESRGNPIHAERGLDLATTATNPGGNMEGKEVRFGIANSALFATVTTDASCGAVNSMHDSFTPLGGLVPLVNMQLGEVVFGGVGAGLYGILMMVVLTVFIAGLMVGRTPEYLGKKIQAREVQMAMLYVLVFPAAILVTTAISVASPMGLAGLNNQGPHGLSEILYAFSSTAANNGSAFAGLTGGTPYYNTMLGVTMLIGRFAMMVPMLALAGFLAEKKIAPESAGTFPVTSPLFVVLLVGVIVIVSALTFFPALALGPIVEHLLMGAGRLF